MSTVFIGIDPGVSGAIAVLWPDGRLSVTDLNGSEYDTIATLNETRGEAATDFPGARMVVCIEKLSAAPRPKQKKGGRDSAGQQDSDDGGFERGSVASFKLGESHGFLRGACMALGMWPRAVLPAAWKRVMIPQATGKSRKEQKQAARDMARSLWPERMDTFRLVKHADRADAALIAEYGRRKG